MIQKQQQEVLKLSGDILALKAELYDLDKVRQQEVATLTKVYGEALLRAAELFSLKANGLAPTTVDEFHAALTEFSGDPTTE